ncbi:MAG TPA: magnesium/cobalt transporter CorA, partial [Longimicrobiaceae bacterium]|nr:magnesium/cobalt transporter CorA [Longimicrobiaceae bacterium]
DLETLRQMRGKWPVLWVNVDGVGHPGTVQALGDIFALHRLGLEDVTDVPQRAKVAAYGDHLLIVARMARLIPELDLEQIGIFVGRDYVLTFQERPGDPLDPVRARIRAGHPRIRGSGPDYLAYAVIDAIVDHYFPVLESYADRLDALEEEIVGRPSRRSMNRLHHAKRELMSLRRAIWPLRDALAALVREPGELVTQPTLVYLRDCQEHAVQIVDLVETYRDLGSSLTDLYLSSVSHRMNEIMKVLTIFASIFIPLGFVTGIYGMNLVHPPVAWYWRWGFAFGVMGVVALGLLAFFWRQGWLGREK